MTTRGVGRASCASNAGTAPRCERPAPREHTVGTRGTSGRGHSADRRHLVPITRRPDDHRAVIALRCDVTVDRVPRDTLRHAAVALQHGEQLLRVLGRADSPHAHLPAPGRATVRWADSSTYMQAVVCTQASSACVLGRRAHRVVERDRGELARVRRPRNVGDVARVPAQRGRAPPPFDIRLMLRAERNRRQELVAASDGPEHDELVVGSGGEDRAVGRPPRAVDRAEVAG